MPKCGKPNYDQIRDEVYSSDEEPRPGFEGPEGPEPEGPEGPEGNEKDKTKDDEDS